MNDGDKVHTAAFLKRQAKKLKKETGVPHFAALDKAAQSHGYANWKHFCNTKQSHASSGATGPYASDIPIAEISNLTATKPGAAPLPVSSASESTISFTQWLAKHRKRDSPLGDLARDAAADGTWPTDSNAESYRG